MRFYFLTIALYLSFFSYSQNLDKSDYNFNPDTLDLSSTEKIYGQKDFLIKCMDYYLSKKIGDISKEKMNCLNVFVRLNRNKDFQVGLVKFQPHKLTKGGNMSNQAIYWVGQTKLKLENRELLRNDTILVCKSIELFLDYCLKEENKVHLTKEMKKVQQLRETDNLYLYIQQLIDESKEKIEKTSHNK